MDALEAINQRIAMLEQQRQDFMASLKPLDIALGELYSLRASITGEAIQSTQPGVPVTVVPHSEKEAPPVVLSPKSKTPVVSGVQQLRQQLRSKAG